MQAIQENPIKAVFPSPIEKMKVGPALTIFSPTLTAFLRSLEEAGDPGFKGVGPTVAFQEMIYK